MARKFGRGRRTVSESGSRVGTKDIDAESVRGRKVARGRLRRRGKGNYSRVQSTSRGRSRYRAKDGISISLDVLMLDLHLVAEALQNLETPGPLRGPIIDTPIDVFDTAGLISPNPERASLPIMTTPKEEIVKKSSAWSKEGKREREMSTLILPRPERITMPAAILPTPEELKKLGRKRKGVDKVVAVIDGDVVSGKGGMSIVDGAPLVVPTATIAEVVAHESLPSVIVNTLQMDQHIATEQSLPQPATARQHNQRASAPTNEVSNAPSETTQLLLQLVNLLRDEQALAALKSMLNNFDPPATLSETPVSAYNPPKAHPQPHLPVIPLSANFKAVDTVVVETPMKVDVVEEPGTS